MANRGFWWLPNPCGYLQYVKEASEQNFYFLTTIPNAARSDDDVLCHWLLTSGSPAMIITNTSVRAQRHKILFPDTNVQR